MVAQRPTGWLRDSRERDRAQAERGGGAGHAMIPAMRRAAVCLALPPLLLGAGCAETAKPQPNLAYACEVRKCECVVDPGSIFTPAQTEPPLWRQDGSAYCPEGATLRLVDKKS